MSAGAVIVSDETISAVVVGLAHHELIGPAARAGMADALASENRWHVHDSWGEPASLFPPAVSGHPWRWRPLAPPVELLTRLDFLRANLPGRDYFAGLDTLDRLDRLHDATVRRLDGYGLAAWQR